MPNPFDGLPANPPDDLSVEGEGPNPFEGLPVNPFEGLPANQGNAEDERVASMMSSPHTQKQSLDEGGLRSMFLGEAAKRNKPLNGTYAINPEVSSRTTPEQIRAAGVHTITTPPVTPLSEHFKALKAAVRNAPPARAKMITSGVLDFAGKAGAFNGEIGSSVRKLIHGESLGTSDIAHLSTLATSPYSSVILPILGIISPKAMNDFSVLAGDTAQSLAQESQEQQGKIDTTLLGGQIGSFSSLPLDMTPAAPLTMGLAGYASNKETARESGATTEAQEMAGVAGGLIDATVGYFMSRGGKSSVPEPLIKNIIGGSVKNIPLFTSMGMSNRAIQEAANPNGGNPLSAAVSPEGIAEDIEGAVLMHTVPTLASAALSRVFRGRDGSSMKQAEQPPAVPKARTMDDIRSEMRDALSNGDLELVTKLKDEAVGIASIVKPHEGKIELDPTRRYGKIDLDLPELSPSDFIEPKPAEQIITEREMAAPGSDNRGERLSGLSEGLGQQGETVKSMLELRGRLEADLQTAKEQAKLASRKRGPNGRRLAEKTVNGLQAELHALDGRISSNTGKWVDNSSQDGEPITVHPTEKGIAGGTINDTKPSINSNGNPIHTNSEGVKNFWDSFEGSKTVTESGEPIVLYHGGKSDFEIINPEKYGSETDAGFHGKGFYASEYPEYASGYAERGNPSRRGIPDSGNIKPVYMDIKNPFEAPDREGKTREQWRDEYDKRLTEAGVTDTNDPSNVASALKSAGYDGVIQRRIDPLTGERKIFEAVTFDPAQVKSAIGNTGEFSKSNPSMLHAGLNPFEAIRDMAEHAKLELGLPKGATDVQLAQEVMARIGRLGASVKETVVRIMSKVKGISRELATAIANHLHEAVSGSRESQSGAIGHNIHGENLDISDRMTQSVLKGSKDNRQQATKKPKESEFSPEEDAYYLEKTKALRESISATFSGDEFKSERAGLYRKIPSKSKMIADLRKKTNPEVKPQYEYRKQQPHEEGSISGMLNKFLDQTTRRVAPSLVDQAGARAGDIARFETSKASNDVFRINRRVRSSLVKLFYAPEHVKELVTNALETEGGTIPDNLLRNAKSGKDLAETVQFVKVETDKMGQALKDAGVIDEYVNNYLHHSFKETPEQIELAIQKKSPTGNLGYLIKRHGPDTYAIGKALGLTPKEPNPLQNFFDDFVNKQKFIIANGIIKGLMAEGLVTKEGHPGYVRLNSYLHEAVAKSKAGGAGEYFAPKSVADLLNNHLGEGFERNIAFRGLRAFNNSMNHVNLGLSWFHGMFIMRDMSNTLLGSGLTSVIRGDLKEGFRQIGLGALPIIGQRSMYKTGKQFRDAIVTGEMTPEMAETHRAYMLGGGSPELSPEYINDTLLSLGKTLEKAKNIKLNKAERAFWGVATAAQILPAGIEMVAKPIMEHLVPNAKAGAFRELWKVESKLLPPNATDAQIAVRARKLVNDIDDRMGQLIYSNLHLPSAVRQGLTLIIKAGGWDIGSLRAIYGALGDTAHATKMLGQDAASKAGIISPEKAETIEMRRNQKGVWGPESYITQRMGYGIASALSMAITNGMVTYIGNKIRNMAKDEKDLKVEETPHGLDYIFPRIGDERFSVAGYEKEAVQQWKILKAIALHGDSGGIPSYISHKTSPIYQVVKAALVGTDWKGDKTTILKSIKRQYTPIVGGGMGDIEPPTSSLAVGRMGGPAPIENVLKTVGITPAPNALIRTDAENRALDILHENKTPLSEVEADHSEFVNRMALYYKSGDMEVYDDAVKRGLLTAGDQRTVRRKSKESDLLKGVIRGRGFPPEEALKIYRDYASPEEQDRIRGIMNIKRSQARSKTTPEKMDKFKKEWGVLK